MARSETLRRGLQALSPTDTVLAAAVLSNGFVKHQVLHVLGVTDRWLMIAPVRHAFRWKVLEPVERFERVAVQPPPVAASSGFSSVVVAGRQFYVDRVGCAEIAAVNAAIDAGGRTAEGR